MNTETSHSARVFSYSDPREFLAATFHRKQSKNPGFSLRAWSRQLGFGSPSFLSAILRGERKIKPRVAAKLIQSIPLEGDEARYFELLVLVDGAKHSAEKALYGNLLAEVMPKGSKVPLDLEKFRLISDWYHLALLEAVDLKHFSEDAQLLSQRFRGKIPASLIPLAIERLLRLELLIREKGKLKKGKADFKAGDAVPSDAIKSHHAQMIERAREALYEQPIDERDFRGSTVAIRRKDFTRAAKLVRKFHESFQKLAAPAGEGDEVYRLNSQLFKLTAARRRP